MLSRAKFAVRAFVLIVIAATVAILPMCFHGIPWGHDSDLHIPAWMEASQQMREGIVYPRWAAGANYGFGNPFFIFYPPLSWSMGAVLGLILPWKIVPGLYVWLVLIIAGAAMWKCASEWLDPPDAMLAGLLYTLNPYLFVTAYKRCNYAELLATALFPLLVWSGVRIGRDGQKTILTLSIVFAAIWLADLPAAVVASYSLAWLLLFNSFIHRSLRPLVSGAVAIFASFGGIAAFLLPAAWERNWVNIGEALRSQWAPEKNFLFAHNDIPSYASFNKGLSLIALFLIIATALTAVLARRLRRDVPNTWRLLSALGGLATLMMFPPSLILWRVLPELRFVEFPWRWLSPLCVVFTILTASVLAQARRRWAVGLAAVSVLGGIGAVILHTVSWDAQHHLNGLLAAVSAQGGYQGANWCQPLGSDPSALPKAAPLVALKDLEGEKELSEGGQIRADLWSPERKLISVDSPRPALLKIKLLTYPAWQAQVNGKIVALATEKATGQMLMSVPAGSNSAEIKFVRTSDRMIGIAVSLATILAVVLLTLFSRWGQTPSEIAETGKRPVFSRRD